MIVAVVRALGVAAAAAGLVSGCAAGQVPQVERVATTFASGDPATRCALLAPATRAAVEHDRPGACPDTVAGGTRPGGQVQHVEVWGDQALVRLADDTLFLTRAGDGWAVSAAGCAPAREAPYACRLEGP